MIKLSLKKSILIMICGIIFISILYFIKAYAYTSENYRKVSYGSHKYYIGTELIKFHSRLNGYDKTQGVSGTDNLSGGDTTMRGYGQYNFKDNTSLFDFLTYCHTKESSQTEEAAKCLEKNGRVLLETDTFYCDFTKLSGYRGQVLAGTAKTQMDDFWTKMNTNLGDRFKELQDSYFFEKYTYKAARKLLGTDGISDLNESTGFDGDSYDESDDLVWEYLSALTTYTYSKLQQAVPSVMTIGNKDLIPFLYMQEQGVSDLYEIAMYAYVPLIEGWMRCSGEHHWEEEFEEIFDESYDCDAFEYTLDDLNKFYYECLRNHKNEKGEKGNPLLGEDISVIIHSDYDMERQIEATKVYLERILGELGFNTNLSEIAARNELMARYMMENEHINSTIKDYTAGIHFMEENLQRGTSEYQNTHTAILSDFQVIEFPYKLDLRNSKNSDEDSLSDGVELGSEKWVEITDFARKAYNATPVSDRKSTFNEQCYEFVRLNPGVIRYDGSSKLEYRVFDYTSNPILDDTDFDGIKDDEDSIKLDGNFKGTSTDIGSVDFTNDFRYFFIDDEKYNDELAVMSLIMSNLADNKVVSTNQASGDIESYMEDLGFTNIGYKRIEIPINGTTDKIKGNVYIGKKTIQYIGYNEGQDYGTTVHHGVIEYGSEGSINDNRGHRCYKDVHAVFIGGFDNSINYKKLLVNFNRNEIIELYKKISDEVYNYIKPNLIDRIISLFRDNCFWVSGYSIGGGVASEIADRLSSIEEVYCYTFGSTNPNDEGSGTTESIKNIINVDDLIPKIYNLDNSMFRKGNIHNDSIYDNWCYEFEHLTNTEYKELSPKTTNRIKKYIDDIRSEITDNTIVTTIENKLSEFLMNFRHIDDENMTELSTVLNENRSKIEQSHSIKSYYVLSKNLDGFSINNYDESWEEVEEEIDDSGEIQESDIANREVLQTLEKLGVWYVNHVATYQNNAPISISTNPALDYYNKKDEYPRDANGQRLTTNDDEKVMIGLGGKKGFFYEPFKDMESTYQYNATTGRNYYKRYLGNDCSGLAQGVIYTLSDGDRGQTGDVNSASDGLFNHNVSAEKLVQGYDHTDDAMLKLGYNKYYLSGSTWRRKRFIRDEVEDLPLTTIYANPNYQMTINFLQPGDLLCTVGHVEYYVGYNYTPTYNVRGDKKTGIRSIVLSSEAEQGHSTFGWGGVHDTFPSESNYFTYSGNVFKKNGDTRNYTAIWRKSN